jgi:hypothetical protein
MDTYFLKYSDDSEPVEVSKERFIRAERSAGFYPKSGEGLATGGFSANGIQGSIVHKTKGK